MKTNIKPLTENDIAKIVVDAAIKVHRVLGPGLLESVYEEALFYELVQRRGLHVEKQVGIPAFYEDIKFEIGFRADLIVENKVIVEIKSVESLTRVYFKQVLTYLKLTNLKLGLLINFNEHLVKNGIRRIVNNL